MIIMDKLRKGVIFKDLLDTKTKIIIERFIHYFYKYYGLLNAIISN
jgi:hypothetical protein